MADIVTMPKLGFDMAEGTISRWAKKEGETVEKGQLLAEIETDKATVEVESQFSGVVRKLLVGEGSIVPVNQPIAIVGTADETIDVTALVGAPTGDPAPTPEPAAEPAKQPEPAAEPAPTPVATPAQPTVSVPVPAASNGDGNAAGNLPGGVRATPLARRIAADKGVQLAAVSGSGPQGRIVRKDVEAALTGGIQTAGTSQTAGLNQAQLGRPLPLAGPPPADERVPLSRLRQAIGRRMVSAKQAAPHFYVTHEFEMENVLEMRKQANAMLEGSGEKLSVNDFIVKAVALALREFPNLNASLDGDAVLRHGRVNIGNAVAVENGLLVVVTPDADRLSLRQISLDVRDKAARARSGKVQPADVEGSTFSISNLGMYDVFEFIAILNPPEAAILAVGSALEVPVVKNGAIVPGWRMKATVSVDHRVSDGAEAAQFMQAVAKCLENPLGMVL
ncbi:MAG: 2-oxo acid dehydrogenase subunit E2 [Anaerolineae bacterium]|nr:MAG: 2-oxo acid dehydrogenase subunit E2 [Anaerolineae bacterium]